MLHIGVVAPGPVANDSGGRTYLINLARHASTADVRLTFMITAGQEYLLPPDVSLITLPRWSASTLGRLFAEHFWIPILALRYDLDGLYFPNNFAAFLSPVPYVVAIRSMLVFNKPGSAGTSRQIYRTFQSKRSARRAQLVITPSAHTKHEIEHFLGLEPDKIAVIPHGVDGTVFSNRSDAADARAAIVQYGIQPPYLLYVSSLWPYKNHDKLIHAFEKLKSVHHIPHHLVLVGRGMNAEAQYHSDILALIQRYRLNSFVHMIDFLPHDKLAHFYRFADLFVFPSETESYGNPIFEAMASGVPVVCSSTHHFEELVDPAARYANPHDRDELARVIKQVLDDGELRQTMIRQGLDRVQALSWTGCVQQTLRAIRRAVENA